MDGYIILSGITVLITVEQNGLATTVKRRKTGDPNERRTDIEERLQGKIVTRSRLLRGEEIRL